MKDEKAERKRPTNPRKPEWVKPWTPGAASFGALGSAYEEGELPSREWEVVRDGLLMSIPPNDIRPGDVISNKHEDR